jgi:hypothetical protein
MVQMKLFQQRTCSPFEIHADRTFSLFTLLLTEQRRLYPRLLKPERNRSVAIQGQSYDVYERPALPYTCYDRDFRNVADQRKATGQRA